MEISGLSGIGGVLRNGQGKVLCVFSLNIVCCDPNDAELQAVAQAVSLISSNSMLRNSDILIASDSKMAVAWINGDSFGNINLVQKIYDIRSGLKDLGGTVVVYTPRHSNSYADNLAKMGSSMSGDFISWDVG